MMTLEEMKRRKQELGFTNERLAGLSGVPLGTVQKIMSGATLSPREETLKKLWRALNAPDDPARVDALIASGGRPGEGGLLAEPGRKYAAKQPGEYTLEDYLALPDEQRVELIDGVFYDMAAPTTVHQAIGGFIHKQLLDYVMEHGGECMPFMSPVDVQLDCDDRTVVQPDVLIVCDRSKFRNGRVFGAPDFLAEVLSPSTRKKDMQLKLFKYANAGVREYWMIDPDRKTVVVYDLEHEELPQIYRFSSRIPVLVWNGECEVDFPLMMKTMGFLYET